MGLYDFEMPLFDDYMLDDENICDCSECQVWGWHGDKIPKLATVFKAGKFVNLNDPSKYQQPEKVLTQEPTGRKFKDKL